MAGTAKDGDSARERFLFTRDLTLFFVVLVIYALFNRGPYFFPDSGRYLSSAEHLMPCSFSPYVVPFLLRPLYMLIGPWAFVAIQSLMMAYLMTQLKRVFDLSNVILLLCLVASSYLSLSSLLMMDAYLGIMALGVLLYIVTSRKRFLAIIAFSASAHFSFVVIATLGALIMMVLKVDRKRLSIVLSVLVFPLLAFSTSRYISSNPDHKTYGNVFVCARLMADVPQAFYGFVEQNPESLLARKQMWFKRISDSRGGGYIWRRNAIFKQMDIARFSEEEAWDFLTYSLKNHFWAIIKSSMENSLSFLAIPMVKWYDDHGTIHEYMERTIAESDEYDTGHPIFAELKVGIELINRYLEEMGTLQHRGHSGLSRLTGGLGAITGAVYYLSLIVVLAIALLATRKEMSRETEAVVALSVAFVIANAAVMPNLSGNYARYHTQVFIVPICAAAILSRQHSGGCRRKLKAFLSRFKGG